MWLPRFWNHKLPSSETDGSGSRPRPMKWIATHAIDVVVAPPALAGCAAGLRSIGGGPGCGPVGAYADHIGADRP